MIALLCWLTIAIEPWFVAGLLRIDGVRRFFVLSLPDVLVGLSEILRFSLTRVLLALVRLRLHVCLLLCDSQCIRDALDAGDVHGQVIDSSALFFVAHDAGHADVAVADDEADVAIFQIGIASNREIEIAADGAIGGILRNDAIGTDPPARSTCADSSRAGTGDSCVARAVSPTRRRHRKPRPREQRRDAS